jgi:hypothetical protein
LQVGIPELSVQCGDPAYTVESQMGKTRDEGKALTERLCGLGLPDEIPDLEMGDIMEHRLREVQGIMFKELFEVNFQA